MSNITIIGAGGVGTAAAADLTLKGHNITLYEIPQFSKNVDPIIRSGGIKLSEGKKTSFVKIHEATTDIVKATKDARIIMVATVGWAHSIIAELSAPHLKEEQVIVLFSAELGSLEFKKILVNKRPDLNITIAETLSAPYASRRDDPNKAEVIIRNRMRDLGLAAIPRKYTEQVLNEMNGYYPGVFAAAENVVEVGLSNINIFAHPIPVLLMTAWIEKCGSNHIYASFTPSVLRVIEALFLERNAILKTLGLKELYTFEQIKEMIANPELHKIKGPSDMQHRFITEDCPMGLVALASLGDLLGVSTPVCKATITLISQIIGTDYFEEGRNLERLGLSGLSPDQLKSLLNEE